MANIHFGVKTEEVAQEMFPKEKSENDIEWPFVFWTTNAADKQLLIHWELRSKRTNFSLLKFNGGPNAKMLECSPPEEDSLPERAWFDPESPNKTDSGVSTMESGSSRVLTSLSDILLSEANNNYPQAIDVVRLLRLKSTDKEEQVSNSSSLESLTSIQNHQGSQEPADYDDDSGSTSCSEDSFEMSSTCTERTPDESPLRRIDDRESRETTCDSFTSAGTEESEANSQSSNITMSSEGQFMLRLPPVSVSMDSFMNRSPKLQAIRQSIEEELNRLDTGLPQLDFDKLEKQLQCAAREREEQERKLLGEEVRRRLAEADFAAGPSIAVSTHPNRSNLAVRLQNAMNLQVCYMNELSDSTADESDSDSDDDFLVSRSRSTPNLKDSCRPSSSKETSEALRLRDKAKERRKLDCYERQTLLHAETKRVLLKAKQKAQNAVDELRRTRSKASVVPRQSRVSLSRMTAADVRAVKAQMDEAIERKNRELVELLLDRDSLHMEHDSLLVDIEDFTEHESQASALDFGRLLGMQDGDIPPASVHLAPLGPTFPGHRDSVTSAKVAAPTPSTTPTSPSKTFLPALPKSLSKFSLFRR